MNKPNMAISHNMNPSRNYLKTSCFLYTTLSLIQPVVSKSPKMKLHEMSEPFNHRLKLFHLVEQHGIHLLIVLRLCLITNAFV